ncbi:MAG: sigma-70 family RNA polymerase sigma factor [Flavobacteriales bacterium]|nr:MAG: sigma-70 family RNA polymerase sigma factor [Flavobacteriales bacterium]
MLNDKEGLDPDFLRLKADDVLAYELIYNKYAKLLLRHAFSKTADKIIAEELVQNIFISLWENRHKLNVINGQSYLFSALKFSVINHYRSLMVQHKYEDYVKVNSPVTEDTILQGFEEKELSQQIEIALNHLPNKTKEVFLLSRMQHQNNKEISAKLNISEKAVEYHITQSLKWLRHFLKKSVLSLFL